MLWTWRRTTLRRTPPSRARRPAPRPRLLLEGLEERTLLSTGIPLNASTWTALGPAPITNGQTLVGTHPVSGRVTGLAADPTDANTLYAAAAGGGVWKTTDGGTNWAPLTDHVQDATNTPIPLFMGSLALAPTDHNVIYAGTGETNFAADSFYGRGVLKSTDGGATWTVLTANGAFDKMTIAKIAVDPTDANIAYAAVSNQGVNGGGNTCGIWRTADGGATWTQAGVTGGFGGIAQGPYTDVVIDPTTPTKLFMAFGTPYTSGFSNGVYVSVNSGRTWTLVGGGLPSGATVGRITLALAPSNSQVVYASFAQPLNQNTGAGGQLFGVYKSTDGGTSWTQLASTPDYMAGPTGGQGWFNTTLAVSPTDPNTVFAGGSTNGTTPALIETTDGGTTWFDAANVTSGVAPQGEEHAAAFDANGKLVVGDAGGVFRLDNPAAASLSWSDLNGDLQITQFNGFALDPTTADVAYGGTQGTGSVKFDDALGWSQLGAGSFGVVRVAPNDPNTIYRERTGISLEVSTDGGQSFNSIAAGLSGTPDTYAAFTLDPSTPNRILYGTDSLFESTNGGASWTMIGAAGTSAFNQFHSPITAVAVAPSAPSTIYVTIANQLFFTVNNGFSWAASGSTFFSRTYADVAVDPTNPQVAYVVCSQFSGGLFKPRVLKTTDGGATQTDVTHNFPDTPANCVVIDPRPSVHTVYVGTDVGVYFSQDDGASWSLFGGGLPNARVAALELNTSQDVLAAATHGRGLWEILIPGPAEHLVFSQPPTDTPNNTVIAPAVQVAIVDSAGVVIGSDTSAVTLALGANPAGGTLSGTLTVAAVNGVATFPDLSIDAIGTGYTLTASAGTLGGATSAPFNITVGAPDHLVFVTQPTGAAAGTAITPAVRVRIEDKDGNLVNTATSNVTLALGANPGSATLGGTLTVAAVGGIAVFGDLTLDKVGTGYTLAASSGTLTGATSTPFDITPGPADHILFSRQPADTTAGGSTGVVQVRVEDVFGNLVTAPPLAVTLALGANPGGATLGGTLTVSSTGGIASFNDLTIDKVGTGYTLTASGGTLASVTSAPFDVALSTSRHLVFSQQPTSTTGGGSPGVIEVRVLDAGGNLDGASTDPVTLALGTNPGGATLSGTLTVTASGGIATFGGLTIDKAGTGYTLTAGAAGLGSATSSPFDVTPGPATRLVFGQQPVSSAVGVALPAVQVLAADAGGNLVTSATPAVTLALGANPAGATLGGTRTVTAVGGVATFGNLTLNKIGTGYTLTASSGVLAGATSNPFNITAGAPHHLVISQQPTGATGGGSLGTVKVLVEDALGNLVTTATLNVTLALGANPRGATLGGTLTVAAVGGIATFSNLKLDKVGTGYTLVASSGTLAPATSTAFNVTAGPAAQLVIVQQPVNTTGGGSPGTIVVHVLDAGGNLAVGSTISVTISLGVNPGGATLGGTLTVVAVGGIATFDTLTIDKAGAGYTFVISAGTLPAATSTVFTVSAAPATQLVFSQLPTGSTGGGPLGVVQVQVVDALGNVVVGSNVNVTIALGGNPGGAVLSGTLTVPAVNGIATFTDLSINLAGGGYTLVASAGGLPAAATPTPVVVTLGPAAGLVFLQQPVDASGGGPLGMIQVQVVDPGGNLVDTDTSLVTIALGANPGGATLVGTLTVAAVNGVATFNDLSLDRAGAGYALTATSGALTAGTSRLFSVVPGLAHHVVFAQQPTDTPAGSLIRPAVQVLVVDVGGNVVPTDSSAVTLALGANPGGATLHGTVTVTAVGGVATFADLSLDRGGTGYTLVASDGALGAATSAPFAVAAGGQPPVARDDAYRVRVNGTLTVPASAGVLANDSDADNDPLTAALVTPPPHGTLTLNADGSFSYQPDAGFVGTDTFTYQVADTRLPGNTATVRLTVGAAGIFATGVDAGGGPNVLVFDAATGAVKFNFFAYATTFTGGVRVAVGDVNADGTPDVITVPGPGGPPDVHVYDGTTGGELRRFFAFGQGFLGGLYLAAGDVNADGFADIVVGADAGGGPNVAIFDGRTTATGQPINQLINFFPFATAFTGGVRVAAGDVNGDGHADLVCAAGPGGGPNVSVISGADGRTLLGSFFPYDVRYTGGLYLAAGDVNGDGKADIITGTGRGGGPNVAVISGADFVTPLASFFPYDQRFSGGVRVGAVDRNGDDLADVVCVAGPGGGPDVRTVNAVTGRQVDDFFAYDPRFGAGLFVAGSAS